MVKISEKHFARNKNEEIYKNRLIIVQKLQKFRNSSFSDFQKYDNFELKYWLYRISVRLGSLLMKKYCIFNKNLENFEKKKQFSLQKWYFSHFLSFFDTKTNENCMKNDETFIIDESGVPVTC